MWCGGGVGRDNREINMCGTTGEHIAVYYYYARSCRLRDDDDNNSNKNKK